MKNIIEVKNLTKSFANNHVIKGIDLEVKKGESIVIIGGSGSGKSVFLKCLLGLYTPDKASVVRIMGEDLTKVHIAKRHDFVSRFGMLFQGGALFDSLPIWKNIVFGLQQAGKVNDKEGKALALKKLQMVGLKENVLELYPSEISGGMQKRVALARAIATDPEILFFDEPTSGLDPIMSGIISDLIRNISHDLGATTITITHDMDCAKRIGDRIVMLYQGEFIWQGTGEELDNADNPYVQQFIKGEASGPIDI